MASARPAARVVFVRLVAVAVGALGVSLALSPATVTAHTGVDFTQPAADETVAGPVSVITVAFTDPVALVGVGFEVFTPAGEIVSPPATTDDGAAYQLQLDPPLSGGDVGVAYEVTSADGHLVEGTFRFTVLAAPSVAPVTPVAPVTSVTSTVAPVVVATTVTSAVTPVSPVTQTVELAEPPDSGGNSPTGVVIGIAVAALVGVGGVAALMSRRSVNGRT